jgi:hypothetical protein
MSTDKSQDAKLMTALEQYIRDGLIEDGLTPALVADVIRDHERKMTVAFPDGRVVTLVLYGPRGAA